MRFVVTGTLERVALPASIGRPFGAHAKFVVAPGEVSSFTSTPLSNPSRRVLDTIDKFADKLLFEVDTHEDAHVVGVDDLEFNDPELTVGAVRAAIERRLQYRWRSLVARQRARSRLVERCSFHLLVPMPEAYFFGEPDALKRARADQSPSLFNAETTDVEHFEVEDPIYLGVPEMTPALAPNAEVRKRTWAKSVELRRRHPKLYLKFLSSPNDPFGDRWRSV
ncbi:MAG: hypothetical protein HY791_05020 [Deltaproteobacteria bacterium]|nr:hypothetical protein [Deltaproteobacteria bacterium]